MDEAGQISETATPSAFPTRLEFKNTTVSEADLAALLQATQSAGYKISVDSPETMPEVEGLTHNHIIEIAPNVFMKFKHSYVVVETSGQGLKFSDPHGKQSGNGKDFYNDDLANNISKLYDKLGLLTDQLAASNYSSFPSKTKVDLEEIFRKLDNYVVGTSIEKIKSKWDRLINRKELKEDKDVFSGLKSKAGESFVQQVNKITLLLKQEDIGKGFIKGQNQILRSIQALEYNTLKENFDSVRINKLT